MGESFLLQSHFSSYHMVAPHDMHDLQPATGTLELYGVSSSPLSHASVTYALVVFSVPVYTQISTTPCLELCVYHY